MSVPPSGDDDWLVMTVRSERWSDGLDDITNSNQMEWRGGSPQVVPGLDNLMSLLQVRAQHIHYSNGGYKTHD